MCYEALQEMAALGQSPDVIFGPCGGGGLLSGTYLAKELLLPGAQVHGVEPELANDAYRSLNSDKIYRFSQSPKTIADGLRALAVSQRTLNYLQKLDEFHMVNEESIRHWTAWLIQIMKVTCEPSAAISLAAAHSWLDKQPKNQTILILITGGKIDKELYKELCAPESLLKATH